MTFGGDGTMVVDVARAERPSAVVWHVRECMLPEWPGTIPSFTLRPAEDGGCELSFRHEGLRPRLECWDQCRAGWDRFLPSLRAYVETGEGAPIPMEPSEDARRR